MAVNGYDDLSAFGWGSALFTDDGQVAVRVHRDREVRQRTRGAQDESRQVVLRAKESAPSAGTPSSVG